MDALRVWTLTSHDSHLREASAQCLSDTHPGRVRWWLERYPEARATIPAETMQKIEGSPIEPAPQYLPPLNPETLFERLVPGDDVLELPPGAPPLRGTVYLYQVERTLRIWAVSGVNGQDYTACVVELMDHPNVAVARVAARELARVSDAIRPHQALTTVYEDRTRDLELRQYALAAWSESGHPRVYYTLLDLAKRPTHDLWATAVSSLGKGGDGFALEHLKHITPPGDHRVLYDQVVAALVERTVATEGKRLALRCRILLERCAWADLRCNPYEVAYKKWVMQRLGTHHMSLQHSLEDLRKNYSFQHPGGDEVMRDALTARVHSYAAALLEGYRAKP